MKTKYSRQIKAMAMGMTFVLLLEPLPRAVAQQSSESVTIPLPDSPGAVRSVLVAQRRPEQGPNPATPPNQQNGTPQNSYAENPMPDARTESPGQTQSAPDAVEPAASNPVASQPPQRPHEPVGTAAAESVAVTGVAASRPAGAAVAPAKQRRMRSILIKVGAVIGVGAAVGATMALSEGSPSRPPGSR